MHTSLLNCLEFDTKFTVQYCISRIARTANITIEFMFAGINMFWARLSLAARAKMSLRRALNIFMPKNINSITINITLDGTEKIKTEKNDNKTL